MKIKAFLSKGTLYLTLMCCILLCAMAVIFSRECAQGIKNGLELSLGQLVPSMFFIIVLADFAVKSGILNIGGRFTARLAGAVFGVSESGLWVILLSLVGGYPVGARMAASMYSAGGIDEREADYLSGFCVCAGPGFLINFVGECLLKSKSAGVILFCAQALSVIILGVLSKILFKRKAPEYRTKKYPRQTAGEALVFAVNSGARVCLTVCAAVVVFSGFTAIIGSAAASGGSQLLSFVLTAFAEVTNACKAFAGEASLPMLGFIVGFGGFCVHFQIFGILSQIRISKSKFLIYRVAQGMITALLTLAAVNIFPQSAAVFATITEPPAAAGAGTVTGGAALIFTSMLFIFTVWRKKLCAE